MKFPTFEEWIVAKESTAHKRNRAAAAKGLLPKAVVGSINGGATAKPWEIKALAPSVHKPSKKKRSKRTQK